MLAIAKFERSRAVSNAEVATVWISRHGTTLGIDHHKPLVQLDMHSGDGTGYRLAVLEIFSEQPFVAENGAYATASASARPGCAMDATVNPSAKRRGEAKSANATQASSILMLRLPVNPATPIQDTRQAR